MTLKNEHNATEIMIMGIGSKIRDLRKEKHLTLQNLADAAEVSVSLLSQVERGVAHPSIVSLWRIA
ncbi:MAG: HTH-type transcriptional regulator DdrOP3 [Syntrophomonadaceae bacterium]|nr:HTH-type transcriptional regulator DdrOP3 [Bacillota bacterium]